MNAYGEPRRLPVESGPTAAPVGVKVVLDDGTMVQCDCTYDGVHGGAHMWNVVLPVAAEKVAALRVDEMPAGTAIRVPAVERLAAAKAAADREPPREQE